MTVQVDLLEGMLRRHDWRKAAEFLVSSLGGAGFGTPGGAVDTLNSAGTPRNVLDDGTGAMTTSGLLTAAALSVSGTLTLSSTINIAKGFRWSTVAHVTSTHAMALGESVCFGDATSGAFNVTLNRNSVAGAYVCAVKKVDSSANAVTIVPDFGTIDGAATLALSSQYESVVLQYSAAGSTWYVLAANAGSIV